MNDNSNHRSKNKPKTWFPHVAIVHSEVNKDYFPTDEAYFAEFECIKRSQKVAEILETQYGQRTSVVAADDRIGEKLLKLKPDFCINFVDTIRGSGSLAAGIPSLFELFQLPYLGSNTLALSLTYNKFLTKTLLRNAGIPTPRYQLFRTYSQNVDYDLHFPLILKPNEEHGSVGIDANSVVATERELHQKLKELLNLFDQPILAEEYIEADREVTGFVYESSQVRTHLNEVVYQKPEGQMFKLVTFEAKWAADMGKTPIINYKSDTLDNTYLVNSLKRDIKRAFATLKMDDFARFDIVMDKYENYYFVDCNANPELGPESTQNGFKFENTIYDLMRHNYKELNSEVDNFATSQTA